MLSNYTFTKYKDVFTLGNTDSTTTLAYSVTVQVNCGAYQSIFSGVIAATSSAVITFPGDGDYQVVLTRGSDQLILDVRYYLSLQRSLICNLKDAICGYTNCRDCERQGLDDCVSYQAVFGQIIGYQYLIKPYSPDYCLNGDLTDAFIHQAIELNKCTLRQQLEMQVANEAMYGNIISGKMTVSYLAVIYYLVFYFYERLLAADINEQAYVDAKYYWPQVQFCINRQGVNIAELSALFTSLTANTNLPPTVNSVVRHITYTSGLQTYTFSDADFITGFGDPQGDQPNMVMLLNNAFSGILYFNGIQINGAGFTFSIADANKLTYQYTPTETNHIYDVIYFQVNDTNPTPKYSNMATFTIDVNAYVNQPPSAVGNNSITIGNRVDRVFTLADFTTATTPAYADPESDGVYQLRVDSLPSLGTLELSGIAITTTPTIINASDIVAGNFVYDAPNQDAAAAVSFNFSLADTGSHTFVS